MAANSLRDLPRLARAVQKATGADGINVIQNNEAEAGQVVFHAHFHIIPRNKDDKLLTLPSGGAMLDPAAAKEMATKIQAGLDAPASGGEGGAGGGMAVPVLSATCVVLVGVVLKLLADSGQLPF